MKKFSTITTATLFHAAQTEWKNAQVKESIFPKISDAINSRRFNRYAKSIADSIMRNGRAILDWKDIAKLQYGRSAESLYNFSHWVPDIRFKTNLTKEEVDTPLKIGKFDLGKYTYAQDLAEAAISAGLEVTYIPFAEEPGIDCDAFMAVGLTFKVKKE